MTRTDYGRVLGAVIGLALGFKILNLFLDIERYPEGAAWVLLLALLPPSARRLHDANRSANSLWLGFIPLVGTVILLARLFEPGSVGLNRYGDAPQRPPGEPTAPTPLHRRTYLDADGNFMRSEVVDAGGNVVAAPGEVN
jgi:uncharacterized membrane protein YhaH (DUF805 family)